MSTDKIVYKTYGAILGRLKDDGILSEFEIVGLQKDFIETGTLNGIRQLLSVQKAKHTILLLQENNANFLEENGFKV